MNILISRLSWQPKTPGGGELSAYHHADILRRLGHKVTFITNINSGKMTTKLPIPGQRHLQQLFAWLLLPLFSFGNYDLINAHSRSDQIVFSLLKRLHGKPVVWKDAGDLIHQIKLNREGLFEKINQKILLAALIRTDKIYTLNDEHRQKIEDTLSKLNIPIKFDLFDVIPSDIIFSDYDLGAAPKNKRRLVVGVVGRIEYMTKGYEVLVKALGKINTSNFELWVVGDGKDLGKMKDDCSNMPSKFFGYKDDLSTYYKSFDMFVQPSLNEGFGRTVKEAMYFSLPVIGSRVGGIPDQIKHGKTGLLVKPGDSDELRAAILKLMDDAKLRQSLGSAAHKQVLQDGDMNKLIKTKVIPLFEEVLREPKQ